MFNMKYKERLFLSLLTFSLFIAVQAQTYRPQQIKLAERFDSLANNAPRESAYIQTSKDIYETGEDLWFKVYLLNSQTLIPSLLSKTLYLQLLNEESKKVVWQEKYEIQNGISSGKVYIDNSLPAGDYLLAACTPNSLFNDTAEFKTLRRVKIVADINPIKTDTTKSKILFSNPEIVKPNSIQFNTFPEGGELVSGIQCKLAFKAVNKRGEPIDVKGTLFEDSVPLLEFESKHAGMGSFNFTPIRSKKYLIRLSHPAIDTTFQLPEISPEGMTITLVERNKESLTFKISQSANFNQSDFYLRVQCRGIVYGITEGKISSQILVKIPLSLLPQGIAEVTLFNNNLIPVAERLVYVNQNRKLNISAQLSEKAYPTRGEVMVKLSVKDENEKPVMANLGVSVFDKLYQNPRDSNNIQSQVYLSSQLKGRIFNPTYYFNNSSKNRDESLDLLMLTQGWRKYIWNETNLERYPKLQKQIIFDGIKGELTINSIWKRIKKEQSFVMAFSPDMDKKSVMVPTDSLGVFMIPPKFLKTYEGYFIYLKPFGPQESKPTITITDPFETINSVMKANVMEYPLSGLWSESGVHAERFSSNAGIVRIKDVTIKGQMGNTLRGKYMGMLDSLAKLEMENSNHDYVCKSNILNCPLHLGSAFNKKPVEGGRYSKQLPSGEWVEITYHYEKKVLTEEDLLKMNNLSRVKPYYANREFYKPNYDKEKEDNIIPDFRNTLLWEPSIFTNEKGEATVSFFCSDINTEFVGRIEGVGGEGLLGTEYFKIAVRKLKANP
jgi:hypothetical protein